MGAVATWIKVLMYWLTGLAFPAASEPKIGALGQIMGSGDVTLKSDVAPELVRGQDLMRSGMGGQAGQAYSDSVDAFVHKQPRYLYVAADFKRSVGNALRAVLPVIMKLKGTIIMTVVVLLAEMVKAFMRAFVDPVGVAAQVAAMREGARQLLRWVYTKALAFASTVRNMTMYQVVINSGAQLMAMIKYQGTKFDWKDLGLSAAGGAAAGAAIGALVAPFARRWNAWTSKFFMNLGVRPKTVTNVVNPVNEIGIGGLGGYVGEGFASVALGHGWVVSPADVTSEMFESAMEGGARKGGAKSGAMRLDSMSKLDFDLSKMGFDADKVKVSAIGSGPATLTTARPVTSSGSWIPEPQSVQADLPLSPSGTPVIGENVFDSPSGLATPALSTSSTATSSQFPSMPGTPVLPPSLPFSAKELTGKLQHLLNPAPEALEVHRAEVEPFPLSPGTPSISEILGAPAGTTPGSTAPSVLLPGRTARPGVPAFSPATQSFNAEVFRRANGIAAQQVSGELLSRRDPGPLPRGPRQDQPDQERARALVTWAMSDMEQVPFAYEVRDVVMPDPAPPTSVAPGTERDVQVHVVTVRLALNPAGPPGATPTPEEVTAHGLGLRTAADVVWNGQNTPFRYQGGRHLIRVDVQFHVHDPHRPAPSHRVVDVYRSPQVSGRRTDELVHHLDDTLGAQAHEVAHVLGLPDLRPVPGDPIGGKQIGVVRSGPDGARQLVHLDPTGWDPEGSLMNPSLETNAIPSLQRHYATIVMDLTGQGDRVPGERPTTVVNPHEAPSRPPGATDPAAAAPARPDTRLTLQESGRTAVPVPTNGRLDADTEAVLEDVLRHWLSVADRQSDGGRPTITLVTAVTAHTQPRIQTQLVRAGAVRQTLIRLLPTVLAEHAPRQFTTERGVPLGEAHLRRALNVADPEHIRRQATRQIEGLPPMNEVQIRLSDPHAQLAAIERAQADARRALERHRPVTTSAPLTGDLDVEVEAVLRTVLLHWLSESHQQSDEMLRTLDLVTTTTHNATARARDAQFRTERLRAELVGRALIGLLPGVLEAQAPRRYTTEHGRPLGSDDLQRALRIADPRSADRVERARTGLPAMGLVQIGVNVPGADPAVPDLGVPDPGGVDFGVPDPGGVDFGVPDFADLPSRPAGPGDPATPVSPVDVPGGIEPGTPASRTATVAVPKDLVLDADSEAVLGRLLARWLSDAHRKPSALRPTVDLITVTSNGSAQQQSKLLRLATAVQQALIQLLPDVVGAQDRRYTTDQGEPLGREHLQDALSIPDPPRARDQAERDQKGWPSLNEVQVRLSDPDAARATIGKAQADARRALRESRTVMAAVPKDLVLSADTEAVLQQVLLFWLAEADRMTNEPPPVITLTTSTTSHSDRFQVAHGETVRQALINALPGVLVMQAEQRQRTGTQGRELGEADLRQALRVPLPQRVSDQAERHKLALPAYGLVQLRLSDAYAERAAVARTAADAHQAIEGHQPVIVSLARNGALQPGAEATLKAALLQWLSASDRKPDFLRPAIDLVTAVSTTKQSSMQIQRQRAQMVKDELARLLPEVLQAAPRTYTTAQQRPLSEEHLMTAATVVEPKDVRVGTADQFQALPPTGAHVQLRLNHPAQRQAAIARAQDETRRALAESTPVRVSVPGDGALDEIAEATLGVVLLHWLAAADRRPDTRRPVLNLVTTTTATSITHAQVRNQQRRARVVEQAVLRLLPTVLATLTGQRRHTDAQGRPLDGEHLQRALKIVPTRSLITPFDRRRKDVPATGQVQIDLVDPGADQPREAAVDDQPDAGDVVMSDVDDAEPEFALSDGQRNELTRRGLVPEWIAADGNCLLEALLFTAHARGAGGEWNVETLRDTAAQHVHDNPDYYRRFLHARDAQLLRDAYSLLSRPGFWQSPLHDVMPTAIAIVTGARVTILRPDGLPQQFNPDRLDRPEVVILQVTTPGSDVPDHYLATH